jgi:hypothetical protein
MTNRLISLTTLMLAFFIASYGVSESVILRPELASVINNVRSLSPEAVYAFDVLNVFSHAYDMRERKVLNDNEWYGWLQWIRNCFRLGTIKQHWDRMQENHWYDRLKIS